MGLFRPQRPELMKRSPLHLSVPIGGTETVMGLRPMAYGQDSGVTHDEARIAKKVRASPPPPHARSFYKRYKGPYLEHLSRDAWKKPPKSWRHFFYGQTSEAVYNVPENSEHMQERMEENLVTYLVSCVTERQVRTSSQPLALLTNHFYDAEQLHMAGGKLLDVLLVRLCWSPQQSC